MDILPAQKFPEITSRFSRKKLLLIFFAIIFLVIGIFVIAPFIAEPTSPPKEIFITNITEGQATITWSTDKPTKGTVKVQNVIYKDDGDKNKKSQGFYATHLVTIGALRPATVYNFEIYQGWRKVYEGTFATAIVLNSVNNPNPVYGRVLDTLNRPQVGVIVYLTGKNENEKSAQALNNTTTEVCPIKSPQLQRQLTLHP